MLGMKIGFIESVKFIEASPVQPISVRHRKCHPRRHICARRKRDISLNHDGRIGEDCRRCGEPIEAKFVKWWKIRNLMGKVT